MAAFAGYGYGLPLSRLYARYFHGDLKVNSIEGYGTDAIIYLKTHASDASELLPIFNKTSTKQYKASVPPLYKVCHIALFYVLSQSSLEEYK